MKTKLTILLLLFPFLGCSHSFQGIFSPQNTNIYWCDTLECGANSLSAKQVKMKTKHTESNSQNQRLWFDEDGRVVKKQFGGFTECRGDETDNNAYCENDPCKVYHYFYDRRGLLIEVQEDIRCDGKWNRKALLFYDQENRLVKKKLYLSPDRQDEFTVREYSYDSKNRITEITEPNIQKVEREYFENEVIEEIFDMVLRETISRESYFVEY